MIKRSLRSNKIAKRVISLNICIMFMVLVLMSVTALFTALYGRVYLLQLVILLISALVLFMVLSTTILRRYVLKPLANLSESVSRKNNTGTETVMPFGDERKDEIGDLSRTIRDMGDTLKAKTLELEKLAAMEREAKAALKHREMLLSTVNRAAEILLTANDKDTMEALLKGIELLGHCLDVDCVQIWRNEAIDGELSFVMRYEWLSDFGRQAVKPSVGKKVPGEIRIRWLEMFLKGKCINGPISKLPMDDTAFLEQHNVISTAMLPLVLDNEFFGFFSIGDCRQERTFTDDEMNMITSASLMFTNVFNRNVQRNLAFTDALTGIHNRRYLMETAEQELRLCTEKNLNFSLIIIDIDHFKLINDQHGHASGDAVLKILTARLRHVLKHDTLLARYGGEEFVVTLPGVDQDTAIKTAWRMQKSIEASPFFIGDSAEITVTASFGVASKTVSCTTLPDIMDKADKALYQAKKAGRNTVNAYGLVRLISSTNDHTGSPRKTSPNTEPVQSVSRFKI